MVSNNTPTKSGSNYAVGIIFFIVGFAMIAEHNNAGGFTFIILGFVFLTAGVSGSKHAAGTRPGGNGFPSAPEIREEQASAERKLRKEALGPDVRNRAPAAPAAQQPPVRHPEMTRTERGFQVHMTADEIYQRRDELKGLLDSGIITKEEYYDRLRKLR